MFLRKSGFIIKQSCLPLKLMKKSTNNQLVSNCLKQSRTLHITKTKLLTSIDHSSSEISYDNSSKKIIVSDFFKFDDEINETLKDSISPSVPTHSSTFSNYISHSKTLQALAMLKVELFKIEEIYPETLQYFVKLDLNIDVKSKLDFLIKNGVSVEDLGSILTKNPILLDPKTKIDDLQEIVDYLESKKFQKLQIASLISRLPSIFHFSVPKLDAMFGFYQKLPTNYETSIITIKGNDLRNLVLKCPQLLQEDTQEIFLKIKFFQISCGFTIPQIRKMILDRPNILIQDIKKIETLYKLLMREMEIENELISKSSFVFGTRIKILETRHFYLKSLGKNKYKEDGPGYISLYDITCSTNEDFCKKCETGSLEDFERFMKTI